MINRYFSPFSFAAIALFFFLPFLDIRCNDVSLKQLNGFELATGTTIKLGNSSVLPKDESKSVDLDMDDQPIGRNYFALVALVLAVSGLVLSLLLIQPREIFSGLIAFAGLMCLLLMRIDINSSIEKDSIGYDKYVINLEYLYGYWLAVILFAVIGGYNLLRFVDRRQAELRANVI
jgi:hypothetical protein